MKRRAFVVGTGALLAAEAQQTGKVSRIGYLSLVSAPADAANVEAFRQGLRDHGYVDGQNAVIEARHADGASERLPGLAAELARLKVDVVVASTTSAVRAAQQASPTTGRGCSGAGLWRRGRSSGASSRGGCSSRRGKRRRADSMRSPARPPMGGC